LPVSEFETLEGADDVQVPVCWWIRYAAFFKDILMDYAAPTFTSQTWWNVFIFGAFCWLGTVTLRRARRNGNQKAE